MHIFTAPLSPLVFVFQKYRFIMIYHYSLFQIVHFEGNEGLMGGSVLPEVWLHSPCLQIQLLPFLNEFGSALNHIILFMPINIHVYSLLLVYYMELKVMKPLASCFHVDLSRFKYFV